MVATHKFSLSVQYASDTENLPTRQQFRRWIKAALQREVQIVLRIADESEGRELNRNFRGKDYATNVLTFVYDDAEPTPPPNPSRPPFVRGGEEPVSPPDKGDWGIALPPLYGDVVICAPVVKREAQEQHKALLAHYAHLTVHAALHLQGYDHENEQDAVAMEARETAILLKLGYADPYQVATA